MHSIDQPQALYMHHLISITDFFPDEEGEAQRCRVTGLRLHLHPQETDTQLEESKESLKCLCCHIVYAKHSWEL